MNIELNTELLIKAILENGGDEADLNFITPDFITPEMIQEMGKQLAAQGIKSRTPNPAYFVKPINTVEGIEESFDEIFDWITPEHCPLKPVADESKIIELIKLTPGFSTEASLKEIDELGFEPAPSNYVLGLGVQHPDAHREYKYVVSLDKQNLFPDEYGSLCFLCLRWGDERHLYMIREAGGWNGGWWFAVVRKQPLKS